MKQIVCLIIILQMLYGCVPSEREESAKNEVLEKFLIKKDELNLHFKYGTPERKLSYKNYGGSYDEWKKEALQKFTELIAYEPPAQKEVRELRSIVFDGITYHALVMEVSPQLSIPAYLLVPPGEVKGNVMAVHGHGAVEPVIGLGDDYHHRYGYELAKGGYMVLCPELRGFSTLSNMSENIDLDNLDYWVPYSQFTLVTEGFQHGKTLIGETIADLVAWENWWSKAYQVENFDVAGISYGGDLVLYYPVFSKRVNKIFCSGSLGSFNGIFATCYNAPAHCIPGILKWLDRSDIAGLNAPRPILLHYGELDIPGPDNRSASYNNTVEPAVLELKEIYTNENAEDKVYLRVTPNEQHEMDVELLKSFLSTGI
jgi:dienelactone hydrolase